MLVLIFIGSLLGDAYTQRVIVEQVRILLNAQTAGFIQSILIGLGEMKINLLTIIVSIGTLVLGVVGVFYELKNSLDDLWDTKRIEKETKGWRYFFSSRLLSLSIIPILGFLFIMSIVFSEFLNFVSGYSPIFAKVAYLFQIGTFVFSFFVLSFLFIFIYRFLPKRKLPWRELFRGGLITALLFMFGKLIIGLYTTKLAGTSIFGAAGAFAVLLLWIYYSAQIFLFGASLTYVYSKRYGHLKDNI
jgi:membrane protein